MYATLDDIERAYPGLAATLAPATDPDDPTGVDRPRVDEALAAASEEVDTLLRERYAVPLSPAPALIRRFVMDMALAALPISGAEDNTLIQTRAKAARVALADLRNGETSLGIGTGSPSGGGPMAASSRRVFGPGALRNF